MSKKIVFFRHGQTNWNVEGRIQGHLDIPLNQTGINQALQLAEHIKSKELEIIVSSDLVRAHETAIIVGQHCNVPVVTSEALREINLGTAQGTLKKDVKATFWEYLSSNDPSYDNIGFEKGETKKEARERISSWLKSYLETTQYTRIGICSHNRILQLLFCNLDIKQELKNIQNCEFVEWEY